MKYFLWLTLPLYVLDQVTKIAVLKRFPHPTYPGEEIAVIPGFFDLVRVHNTGMAFGRFGDLEHSNIIFGVISLIAMIVIGSLWRKGAFPTVSSRIAIALLVSGILGNVTDRLWHGYVVDFLSFDLGFMEWPSFNVADACISIAACLLLISAFRPEEEEEESVEAEKDD